MSRRPRSAPPCTRSSGLCLHSRVYLTTAPERQLDFVVLRSSSPLTRLNTSPISALALFSYYSLCRLPICLGSVENQALRLWRSRTHSMQRLVASAFGYGGAAEAIESQPVLNLAIPKEKLTASSTSLPLCSSRSCSLARIPPSDDGME